MKPRTAFHWNKLGKSFASMLETAAFPIESQARFLVFIYSRVLGFMGPAEHVGPGSIMTIDGSPVELSWVIPNRSKPQPGEATRQLRFAIEPLHPDGEPLKGASVLDYLTSPEGSLGVVSCPPNGADWRKKTEDFLYSDDKGDNIPEGSRFFVGFDFDSGGTLTLKAYYLAAARAPSETLKATAVSPNPLYVGDVDFRPLLRLLPQLHPTLVQPFKTILSYFDSLEDRLRPRFQILAMDCVESDANRLKIYCRTMEGTSWKDAKRSFTLDGALSSPEMNKAVANLQVLWDHMFPNATSARSVDLDVASTVDDNHDQEKENDPDEVHAQHPVGGLLYYYELIAGKNTVFPKIYLPVRHYCSNDLFVSDAVEKFYRDVGVEGPVFGENSTGWVAREVAKAFNHRNLDEMSGIQTYVTFAVKKAGWELTSYFSPEVWVQTERE
ncbi:tryptophan dimethylallyltransferase-domain-containing protein [Flagelloscypha sp. PMI_526]|nr:tryptophan dimethylallyltransferase-domain-containing protein [Flagelloscypha sp. PMI_526]